MTLPETFSEIAKYAEDDSTLEMIAAHARLAQESMAKEARLAEGSKHGWKYWASFYTFLSVIWITYIIVGST